MTEAPPHIVVRLFLAGLLAFFAFAPCYIAFWTIVEMAKAPLSTPMDALVALAICIPLGAFLLLLVYRTVTWRGRDSDGGLVPPSVMFVFSALFAVIGLGGLLLTLQRADYFNSLLAIGYIFVAVPIARSYWRRMHGT